MSTEDGIGSRAVAVMRKRWFAPVLIVVVVAVVFLQQFLWGADHAEVIRRLEDKYGAEKIVWTYNGRYDRDTLIVDGRDVSEHCVVTGDWGPLNDLAIECDGSVSVVPVND